MNMNEWHTDPTPWDNHDSHPFPSMNPMLGDMAMLNETFINESHHILLLTLEEAQGIVNDLLGGIDEFFSYRAGPGNIKDMVDGFHSLNRLTTYYNPAGELVRHFSSLRIKATEYKLQGQTYIKITGYPGLRRILKGTRYGARNVQMIELAIGKRGFFGAIVGGIKCCILFSLAWRGVELIFKSDYTLNDFLVDVPMDIVKTIVGGAVIGFVGGVAMLFTSAVIVGPGAIILLGLFLNAELNSLDDHFHLSYRIKMLLHQALIEEQKMAEWNLEHGNQSIFRILNPGW
ncbi:hypothetical protein [Lelliottia nimipressuralis]|uniref:ImpA domain-containing protein n=1 Tax=Lelliottia nimipressuralis TaxID=69220 RepID=A0ABD4KE35_9ENTR|nr:hypothetical protein [Lelliottia nimipressuralis]MBF4180173.1 hypothetical protein [Lelliottia nimipressuralis]